MFIFQASPHSHRVQGGLRIVIGLLFMAEGTMKWFGYPPAPSPMPTMSLTSMVGVAGLIEMFGGFAMTLGVLTRPVAFVLSGEMAVAYFYAHFPHGSFPMTNNGMPAVLFCFLFFYFSFAGPGAWAVDDLIAAAWERRASGSRDPWLPGLPTPGPTYIRTAEVPRIPVRIGRGPRL